MSLETLTLISWIATGIIGGLLCAMIRGGRRLVIYDVIIGIAGAIAGGWGSALVLGDDTAYLYIISVLTGLFVAALALWLFNILLPLPGKKKE